MRCLRIQNFQLTISKISSWNCPFLEELYLDGYYVKDVNLIQEIGKQFSRLSILNIFVDIQDILFIDHHFANLKILQLTINCDANLVVSNLPNLETFDLENSSILNLRLDNLPQLHTISSKNCNNYINRIHFGLNLLSLTNLNVGSYIQTIEQIENINWSHIKNLKGKYCFSAVWNQLISLEVLDITFYEEIKTFTNQFSSLSELSLRYPKQDTLQSITCLSMTLTYLHLQWDQNIVVDFKLLLGMQHLKELSLSGYLHINFEMIFT